MTDFSEQFIYDMIRFLFQRFGSIERELQKPRCVFGSKTMICRQKEMPRTAFQKLRRSYDDMYRALKEPSGAALFVYRNSSPDPVVMLSQNFSEIFERLSSGDWISVYDPDFSECDFVAGDARLAKQIVQSA